MNNIFALQDLKVIVQIITYTPLYIWFPYDMTLDQQNDKRMTKVALSTAYLALMGDLWVFIVSVYEELGHGIM